MIASVLPPYLRYCMLALALGMPLTQGVASAQEEVSYDVTWNTLGESCKDSMPIGNGDLGVNLWTERTGDLVLLIGKTDAVTENGQLVKLGRVRISLAPNPFTSGNFTQTLKVRDGEVLVQSVGADGHSEVAHVWVDANRPVIHVEVEGDQPVSLQAGVELWRKKARVVQNRDESGGSLRELDGSPEPITIDPDTVLPEQKDQLAWCHFNERSVAFPNAFKNQHLETLLATYPDPLLHRTFGVIMKGPGLVADGNSKLTSRIPAQKLRLDLYALTEQCESPQSWRSHLSKLAHGIDAVDLDAARRAHRKWWSDFWQRSWINLSGTPQADQVTQSYAMARWLEACAGRGALPMKFNGSIFTVGQEPAGGIPDQGGNAQDNPDYRRWGGNLWFQNQRQLYWPLLATGDFTLLDPFMKMYLNALPLEKDRVKLHFHHEGASYPETLFFWGLQNNNDFGWGNPGVVGTNTYVRYHIEGGLELIAMMLDRYAYTQDASFAKTTLLPIADAVTLFYDQHWKHQADGRIRMDPATSLETYQNSVNPAPDIAGLMSILPRLRSLPANLISEGERTFWAKLLNDLPPLPKGTTGDDGKLSDHGKSSPSGKPILLPAEIYDGTSNSENPELYAVFPFRLYGVGKPDYDLAKNTYQAKRFKGSGCWGQDGEEAALLGLADIAQSEVTGNFSRYGDQRFKWFWLAGNDWIPDMDNGGAGMQTLQFMLIQCDGKQIRLLPAWPKDWSADFKLYAPDKTVIQAKVRDGKLSDLQVTPAQRREDVIVGDGNAKP